VKTSTIAEAVALSVPVVKTAVGTILICAGIPKLWDCKQFRATIRGFGLLPRIMIGPFATCLPILEILVGATLIVSALFDVNSISWAGALAAALFFMFGAAIAINLLKGRTDISCGCFGQRANSQLTWALVYRAGLLMVLSILTLPIQSRAINERRTLLDNLAMTLVGVALVGLVWLAHYVYSHRLLLYGVLDIFRSKHELTARL
jgi:hypothetical protein